MMNNIYFIGRLEKYFKSCATMQTTMPQLDLLYEIKNTNKNQENSIIII